MIDPAERWGNVRELIDEKRYFILHAPRQTGKTTNMGLLAKQLNQEGKYIALYVNVEGGQAYRNNVDAVNEVVINNLQRAAKLQLSTTYRPSTECMDFTSMKEGVLSFITNWCLELPKPFVLFIDEIDALLGDSLLSVLRQLRSGYYDRPKGFPHALCLIGLRDVRDYRIYSEANDEYILGGSAFNIKEKSLVLSYFNLDQVQRLYQQHTEATEQTFSTAALEKIYQSTDGQPWLVNALGRELCFEEFAVPQDQEVTEADVENAIEILIKRRDVHLDQLAHKLMEPKVMPIIQKILLGERVDIHHDSIVEDKQYLIDLGLVKEGKNGLEIANEIYREIIPRELTHIDQVSLGEDPTWYVTPDGLLNVPKLLKEFVEFYKEHHDMITRRKTYSEAAHHLIFMSWLQRIVNGGGTVQREYATGLGRMDLCVTFGPKEKAQRYAFELKLMSKKALEDGKDQLVEYLKRLSLDQGWLILFQRGKVDDVEALGQEETIQHDGKLLHILKL